MAINGNTIQRQRYRWLTNHITNRNGHSWTDLMKQKPPKYLVTFIKLNSELAILFSQEQTLLHRILHISCRRNENQDRILHWYLKLIPNTQQVEFAQLVTDYETDERSSIPEKRQKKISLANISTPAEAGVPAVLLYRRSETATWPATDVSLNANKIGAKWCTARRSCSIDMKVRGWWELSPKVQKSQA
jgi:hypothetical protein